MRALFAAAALALAAHAAGADTKIVYAEESGPVTAVLYVTAGRVRLELPEESSPLVVRVPNHTMPCPAIGQSLSISIPGNRLHGFDGITGRRIVM